MLIEFYTVQKGYRRDVMPTNTIGNQLLSVRLKWEIYIVYCREITSALLRTDAPSGPVQMLPNYRK